MRRAVALGAVACTVACGAEPDGIRTTTREPAWCQVQTVLAQKCQRCHADPPDNGAPFPLVTYEDTQVVDRREIPRFERMHDAVESEYMPATWMKLDPPVEGLTDNERAVILDWASAGGEAAGGTSCD